ncbi:hypothetical protein Fot_14376 [Forsythia ovata]|uniref:Uncharacterized protein n=1 Tax=Forsythia ovata TaxID=205694 RepID=A0ABD1W659_9LAMI
MEENRAKNVITRYPTKNKEGIGAEAKALASRHSHSQGESRNSRHYQLTDLLKERSVDLQGSLVSLIDLVTKMILTKQSFHSMKGEGLIRFQETPFERRYCYDDE